MTGTRTGTERRWHTPVRDRCHRVAGAGMHGQQTISGGTAQAPVFLHGDLTGSTMLTTDAGGGAASVTYTSFGEPVTAGGVGVPPASCGTRYQYDGGYGYESGLLAVAGPNTNLAPITLQHVGARWYQPGIGRFVQRDPIGIAGGMNCYLYCSGSPLVNVDPTGLRDTEEEKEIKRFKHKRWQAAEDAKRGLAEAALSALPNGFRFSASAGAGPVDVSAGVTLADDRIGVDASVCVGVGWFSYEAGYAWDTKNGGKSSHGPAVNVPLVPGVALDPLGERVKLKCPIPGLPGVGVGPVWF